MFIHRLLFLGTETLPFFKICFLIRLTTSQYRPSTLTHKAGLWSETERHVSDNYRKNPVFLFLFIKVNNAQKRLQPIVLLKNCKPQIWKKSSDLETFQWLKSLILNCYKSHWTLETASVKVKWTSLGRKCHRVSAFLYFICVALFCNIILLIPYC